jgi:hypothetical protein
MAPPQLSATAGFKSRLETKVAEQLSAQRVGYLLGAGSSYLDGAGYPLGANLWDEIKSNIADPDARNEIQAKLDEGATGLENALDLLDYGLPQESIHRHLVTAAIANVFRPLRPPLHSHSEFLRRLARRSELHLKVFNLNYDLLIEWSAERERLRLYDGFCGNEHAFFEPAIFDERIGRIHGTYRERRFDETTKPIHLLKLHGSLGWCECAPNCMRRCAEWFPCTTGGTDRCPFSPPHVLSKARLLMIPPQRRKANDTMTLPYSAVWSAFRGALGQDARPIHRLVCLGYGFGDEHVNAVIEGALARTDFTLLIFTRSLADKVWNRWSVKRNVVVITESRCALKTEIGPGHPDLWKFERVAKEV